MNSCSYIMANKQIKFLKLIQDKSRLKILSVLREGEANVSEIIRQTKLSQSLVSHHLKDLRDGGLVGYTRNGRWVSYRLISQGNQFMRAFNQI
jgi:ArsR family transcriptional regulator